MDYFLDFRYVDEWQVADAHFFTGHNDNLWAAENHHAGHIVSAFWAQQQELTRIPLTRNHGFDENRPKRIERVQDHFKIEF